MITFIFSRNKIKQNLKVSFLWWSAPACSDAGCLEQPAPPLALLLALQPNFHLYIKSVLKKTNRQTDTDKYTNREIHQQTNTPTEKQAYSM